ncbi:MAG: hypothetical protein ACYDDF_00545 [Thermoplasmatota archaeon]
MATSLPAPPTDAVPLIELAGLLLVLMAVANSYLGEKYFLRRFLALKNFPPMFGSEVYTKGTLRFAWHSLSLLAVTIASILLALTGAANARGLLLTMGGGLGATAVLALVTTRGRNPAWAALALAAIAAMWAGLIVG